MADKKSDHYTSAQHYKDLDGNSKSFTFVDHDIKSKFLADVPPPPENWEAIARQEYLKEILSFPAALCPEQFRSYVILGETPLGKIEWNEVMLSDPGIPLMGGNGLIGLVVLLRNKHNLLNNL